MTRRPTPHNPAVTEPPTVLARTYKRSDGTKRRVLVAVDEADAWLVYDVPSGSTGEQQGQLVDHLTGWDDLLGQTLALAADYLHCQIAFHAGEREDMPCANPLPKPAEAPLAVIRSRAARARRVVRRHHSQQPAEQIAA
jgi:hypothetical protein